MDKLTVSGTRPSLSSLSRPAWLTMTLACDEQDPTEECVPELRSFLSSFHHLAC